MNVGTNEWLILSVLENDRTANVTDVRRALEQEGLNKDPGSLYIALERMTTRGLVTSSKEKVRSRDGRPRDVCFYHITPLGKKALDAFDSDVRVGQRVRTGPIIGGLQGGLECPA